MGNLFSTQGVEETPKSSKVGKYIYGGIYHNIVISDVKSGESANGIPYVEVTMHTKEGGVEAARSFNFYFSEAAAKVSMSKLKHISTKIVTLQQFEEINATSSSELAEALRELLKGESLRVKFTSEEYINQSGEVKERANLGLPDFAEAIQEGAEYPVIADEDTKLTYDKTDKYDHKKVVAPTSEKGLGSSSGSLAGI